MPGFLDLPIGRGRIAGPDRFHLRALLRKAYRRREGRYGGQVDTDQGELKPTAVQRKEPSDGDCLTAKLPSQARHKMVSPQETIASRNVVAKYANPEKVFGAEIADHRAGRGGADKASGMSFFRASDEKVEAGLREITPSRFLQRSYEKPTANAEHDRKHQEHACCAATRDRRQNDPDNREDAKETEMRPNRQRNIPWQTLKT